MMIPPLKTFNWNIKPNGLAPNWSKIYFDRWNIWHIEMIFSRYSLNVDIKKTEICFLKIYCFCHVNEQD
jgi:hypothetical protein